MIRPARPDDLPAVEALLQAAELPVDGVGAGIDGFAVCDEGGAVVGAAGLERYDADVLLRSLVVSAAARARGVGRRLVDERLSQATADGARDVYLLTETAAEFFARFGFERIARSDVAAAVQRSEEFTSLCPVSAVVMRRAAKPDSEKDA